MCQRRGLCLLLGNTICLFLMYFTSLASSPRFISPALLVFSGDENRQEMRQLGAGKSTK